MVCRKELQKKIKKSSQARCKKALLERKKNVYELHLTDSSFLNVEGNNLVVRGGRTEI